MSIFVGLLVWLCVCCQLLFVSRLSCSYLVSLFIKVGLAHIFVDFVFKALVLFVSCESCLYPRLLASFVDLICCCVENTGPIIQIIMGNDRSLLLARAEICRVCVPSRRVPEFWLSSRHAAFW